MDRSKMQLIEREALRMQVNREELIERIARAVPEDGTVQPLEGLYLARASVPRQRIHGVIKPSFCMIDSPAITRTLTTHG